MRLVHVPVVAAVSALELLAACAPKYMPPTPPPARPAAPVQASFAKTWDATIDVLASNNLPVETLDRSSGLLVPHVVVYAPLDARSLRYADCGKYENGRRIYPGEARYNIVVRGDSSASTVQVRAFFTTGPLGPGQKLQLPPTEAQCLSRGTFESRLESEIAARAEGRPVPVQVADMCITQGSARVRGESIEATAYADSAGTCVPRKCVYRGAAVRTSRAEALDQCRADIMDAREP